MHSHGYGFWGIVGQFRVEGILVQADGMWVKETSQLWKAVREKLALSGESF
jgi:hypothetical protein